MKPTLGIIAALSLFLLPTRGTCQDIKVREEAVRLLERANLVSSSPRLPNLERVVSFRSYDESGVEEGSFSRMVIQGVGRRDEYKFGSYHMLNIWGQNQVAAKGTPKLAPPQLMNVLRITPIWLVRFDSDDVIHSIEDRSVGDAAARCIEFDTVSGQKTDNNEICVDAKAGNLVSERLAGEVVEYRDFFPFAGAMMPGKISYSGNDGTEKIEITQTMTALSSTDANVLTPPADAQIHKYCSTYRNAYGLSMPQPKAGSGGQQDDIVVRVNVGMDGRVFDATVQSSDREDLNAEAISLVRQWTFSPAMCNGKPDRQEVSVVLHFQGR